MNQPEYHIQLCFGMPQGLLPFSSEHPHSRFRTRGDINVCSKVWRGMRFRLAALMGQRRNRGRNLSLLFIVICLSVYLTFFYLLNDNVVLDSQFVNAVPESVLEQRLDFKFMTIDKMCSHVTSRCYTVTDRKTPSGVERHLVVDGFEDESDSIVTLIGPKGETFDTSDTRIWAINHTHINSQYVAGLMLAPFIVGSLPLKSSTTSKPKQILEIGLGGGSLDMVLSHHIPEANITSVELDPTVITIAEKWFGVPKTANRRTVEGDGLDYVEKMVQRGEFVDVLFLDACDTDPSSPCPAASFRKAVVIDQLRSVLTQEGCLVVNILSHDADDENRSVTNSIVASFTEVFPSCLQLKMTQEINVILVCVPYAIGDTNEQITFYNSRIKSTVASLSLSYILGDVLISEAAMLQ